jgi:hypothetical protein
MRSLEITLVEVALHGVDQIVDVAGDRGNDGPPRCPAVVGVYTW